jgi:TRAP-type mannitol/chloroaromatic compound transport system permease large subunit
LTLGIAAGLGCLASGLLRKRITPTERLTHIIAEKVGDSLGSLHAQAAGPGLIQATLLAMAVKTAVGWLQNADSTADPVDDAGQQI